MLLISFINCTISHKKADTRLIFLLHRNKFVTRLLKFLQFLQPFNILLTKFIRTRKIL